MEFEEINNASVMRLMIVTKTSAIPALARQAAVRLYHLGKKKYAINFLIRQMNRYKYAGTHRNIISETCPEAAKELGRLGDEHAVEPLFEALGDLGYGPAVGLAQHGNPKIEDRLVELAKGETKVAVFAALSLGYMKKEFIVPRLIHLLEQYQMYENMINDEIHRLQLELKLILGAYRDNVTAEKCFINHLDKQDIDWILSSYLYQNQHRSQRWLEWDIVDKYQWQKYISSEKERFPFRHTTIKKWKEFSDVPCFFSSEKDVLDLREQILNGIVVSFRGNL